MAQDPTTESEPSLQNQTMELGKALKAVRDRDPEGRPTPTAATAFRHWLEAAKGHTREQRYFDDVYENFDVAANSNRDLFDLFEMLHPYLEIEDDDFEDEDATPPRFIGLPMA
jgi:hypothetical protein